MGGSWIENRCEHDLLGVNNLFTNMFEIHCNLAVNRTLHLAQPPAGLAGVTHQRAGNKQGIGAGHAASVAGEKMNHQSSQMAALMASRICHDLVSPVGAIANGLELLEMSGEASPELDLIRDSVTGASSQLKLFRIAFGTASPDQQVPADGLAEAAMAAAGNRLSLDWRPDAAVSRPLAKRLCLGLMCFETALPYGGAVSVRPLDEGFSLTAEAERQRDCPELWGWLDGSPAPDEPPAAASLHFMLLAGELAQAGLEAQFEASENTISLRV